MPYSKLWRSGPFAYEYVPDPDYDGYNSADEMAHHIAGHIVAARLRSDDIGFVAFAGAWAHSYLVHDGPDCCWWGYRVHDDICSPCPWASVTGDWDGCDSDALRDLFNPGYADALNALRDKAPEAIKTLFTVRDHDAAKALYGQVYTDALEAVQAERAHPGPDDATVSRWVAELDPHWPEVKRIAKKLLRKGKVRNFQKLEDPWAA